MRIKLFENFKKSLVEQKCDLLDELTLPLKDLGLQVSIHKKAVLVDGYYYGSPNSITLIIKDNYKILEYPKDNTNNYILNNDIIKEFILDLRAFGINPRQMGGGENFCYMMFDKWGKMTNSEVLRKNENFKNDERKYWRLTHNMKSKIDSEIKDVLIELVDNGFEVEIDHFVKKSEVNSILVSVHKINNNEVFNTNEVKDNLEVLVDYMNEYYDVKEYDYNVEIIGAWPNNRAVSEEYPDNLEVIEIDLDIII